jgi:hypothetical protein
MFLKSLTHKQKQLTILLKKKEIQTLIKIPQIYHQHVIGVKIKNHAFSASLANILLTKTRINYHNKSLSNLKHA